MHTLLMQQPVATTASFEIGEVLQCAAHYCGIAVVACKKA
jgi:hypothetical protein